jgi:hypothetical protein
MRSSRRDAVQPRRNAGYRFERPAAHYHRGRVDLTGRQCANSTIREFDKVPARQISNALFL